MHIYQSHFTYENENIHANQQQQRRVNKNDWARRTRLFETYHLQKQQEFHHEICVDYKSLVTITTK